jgi:hypothetical protein
MFERLTWRPKIRQRQWLKRQRLYGNLRRPREPEHEISEEQAEDLDERLHDE